jgi:hypothetical protein
MSQFMLCQGNNQKNYTDDTMLITYPFDDNYLTDVSNYFWKDTNKVFTIVDRRTLEIDTWFTEAQKHLNLENGNFEGTRLFSLLNVILDSATDVVLWYSSYIDDIPCISDRENFFKIVEESIKEPSCEVYIRYRKEG